MERKNNWETWKYKVLILLKSISGGDVVKSKLTKPEALNDDTYPDQAFKVLTGNMTEES